MSGCLYGAINVALQDEKSLYTSSIARLQTLHMHRAGCSVQVAKRIFGLRKPDEALTAVLQTAPIHAGSFDVLLKI